MSERPITRIIRPDQVQAVLNARTIGPNQPTLLNGVPVPVLREEETIRVPRAPAPLPAAAPRAVVYVTRSTAIALAFVAAVASALLTGGLVELLH